MSAQAQDMYYENSSQQRSPQHRQPQHTIQRQSSRPFDGYTTMPPNPMFSPDDHAVQGYGAPRYPDRMNATMNSGYPPSYDTWSAPFGSSQVGTINNMANHSATTRMNMNKMGSRPGRVGLPAVSLPSASLLYLARILILFLGMDGSTTYARTTSLYTRSRWSFNG